MPTEKNNTLKYSEGAKSLKIPYVIYADLECLLLKQLTNLTLNEKL